MRKSLICKFIVSSKIMVTVALPSIMSMHIDLLETNICIKTLETNSELLLYIIQPNLITIN